MSESIVSHAARINETYAESPARFQPALQRQGNAAPSGMAAA